MHYAYRNRCSQCKSVIIHLFHFLHTNIHIHIRIYCTYYVAGLKHFSNGFDDLLSNQLTTPEFTVKGRGRELVIQFSNEASADARLDVYIANSLGHHFPGRIFSSALPVGDQRKSVSMKLLKKC